MKETLTTEQHACVSCGAIGRHLQGCRFAPKEARTIEQRACLKCGLWGEHALTCEDYRPSNPITCGHPLVTPVGVGCPWCSVERLTAERDEWKQKYEAGTAVWNPVYKIVLDERDRLTHERQIALDTASRYQQHLIESEQRSDVLRAALADLLEDTQHVNHNCGGNAEECPVIRAREALAGAADETDGVEVAAREYDREELDKLREFVMSAPWFDPVTMTGRSAVRVVMDRLSGIGEGSR